MTCRSLLLGWGVSILSILPLAAASVALDGHNFSLPDGFTIERVAGPGMVERPIECDFDERGRLYVTDSSGSNDKPDQQLKDKPHRIVRLEDSDGDGRFDKSTVFADKMMFPEGAMWHGGSLYVAAPPVIWKLTDTNDDGVADRREEWFDAKTLTGCANDLHGPYLGPDGWIYWCKGAFAEQTYERPSSAPFVTRAAHIFRRRPEGGLVEHVMTGGMDNPVGLVFTPEGERIFTTTFFQHPGGGQRDGLIHAIYGGVYGKDHDVLANQKRTGDLMPVLSHFGAAAPAGLWRYRSTSFGAEFRDNLFACQFNTRKVSRHVLTKSGASFRSIDSDFLVSDNADFHPTDVIEDADGSLLILDTGGWYKLCCPTSQLWKPDVLGAIYRVRKTGARRINDPRGLRIDWSRSPQRLTGLLDDPRPAVRERATVQLAALGSRAVEPLRRTLGRSSDLEARRNAVWALARIDDSSAREAARLGLKDADPTVAQAAIHAASVRRDVGAFEGLVSLLKGTDLGLKRAAAEALGRLGNPAAVPNLLLEMEKLAPALGSSLPDRILEHSLIYALIELNSPAELQGAAESPHPFVKRAALIALDQMDRGRLDPSKIAPLLASPEPALKSTAAWIVRRHRDWGNSLAFHYASRLERGVIPEQDRAELEEQLAAFSGSAEIRELLARTLTGPAPARPIALAAMARASLKELPLEWNGVLIASLAETRLIPGVVRVARSVPAASLLGSLRVALVRVAENTSVPVETRLQALAASTSGQPLDEPLFEFARARVRSDQPVSLRSAAVEVLTRSALTPAQLLRVTEDLREAGPLELSALLAPFEAAPSDELGAKLVASLREAKGIAGLQTDRLMAVLAKYPDAVQRAGRELAAQLNQDAAQQAAHLDQLLPKLKEGDIRRGQAIFNSEKAACVSCHAIGYRGGQVGPDLTRIGQIRNERDLLEAIVYPSASFVRSYEPIIVSTRSGDEHSGVLRKNAPDEVILATGPETEVRLARPEIVEMRPGRVSTMPQGLDQQLSTAELSDLIAFLKATKW